MNAHVTSVINDRVRGTVGASMGAMSECRKFAPLWGRRHLRSANRHLLAVPRFRFNTYGRRAFSVAGPMAWKSLPDFIRGIQRAAQTVLGVYLKRTCSRVTSASSAFIILTIMRCTNPRTHSLTPGDLPPPPKITVTYLTTALA